MMFITAVATETDTVIAVAVAIAAETETVIAITIVINAFALSMTNLSLDSQAKFKKTVHAHQTTNSANNHPNASTGSHCTEKEGSCCQSALRGVFDNVS